MSISLASEHVWRDCFSGWRNGRVSNVWMPSIVIAYIGFAWAFINICSLQIVLAVENVRGLRGNYLILL